MKQLLVFICPVIIFAIIAIVIIALFNYRLKRRILEEGNLDDNALKFLFSLSGFGTDILKWGIILFFGGLGLIVLEFIPYSADASPLPYGIEIVFLSLGFIIYYLIMQQRKNDQVK